MSGQGSRTRFVQNLHWQLTPTLRHLWSHSRACRFIALQLVLNAGGKTSTEASKVGFRRSFSQMPRALEFWPIFMPYCAALKNGPEDMEMLRKGLPSEVSRNPVSARGASGP